jgi:hypothetical protein
MTALLAFLLGSVLGALAFAGVVWSALLHAPGLVREFAAFVEDLDDAACHAEDCACDACRRFR